MQQPNFTQCGIEFVAGLNDRYAKYNYTGPTRGIFNWINETERPPLITVEGCRALCGTDPDYYEWADASATISTWVLPVIGLILQAPFESNAFFRTVFALARWIGSPIASLSYILWNIKVAGKCALMVDMSTRYEEVPDEDSQFEQIRDSFYLLSVLNQYTIKRKMPSVEAEKLLRISIFSDSLQLQVSEDESRSLVKRRRKLAKTIREARKKGVVPVFISLMWFLFSLVVSIQAAFGQLGSNATAHNLALGLLMAWLPTLILACIVDRNPTSAEAARNKLNRLVNDVRLALLNTDLRETYIRDTGRSPDEFDWTLQLQEPDYFQEDFFHRFAGQGRIRWHYGVAHPILAGIEESFVARYGRDWLRDSLKARTALVKGPSVLSGLHWFDMRETWQILSAICIVLASTGGAFIISYWTPTVGLGCRSGGYLIFTVTALGIGLIESLCWRFIPTHSSTSSDPFTRLGDGMHRRLSRARTTNFITFARCNVSNFRDWWHAQSNRERVESVILRPLELFNTIWLIYIVLAQTFGAYRNCNCMNSIWGSHGGYMDFQNVWFYRANGVQYYWGFGTGLSGIVMVISFTYIVIQWCVQSHLSTVSYDNARNGLLLTRRYKRFMFPLSNLFSKPLGALKLWWFKHVVRRGHYIERGRRSLIWDYHTNNTTSTTTTPYTQQFSPIPLILSPSSHSIPDLPNHLHHHRSSSTGDDTSDPERLQRHRRASSRVSNPDNEGLGLLRGRLGSGGSAVIDDDESATNTRFGYGLRPINSPEGVYNTSRGSPRSSFDEGVSPTRPRNLGP